MGTARRWVFPILRLALVAVIAIALAKLAFFPDRPPEEASALPTGAVVDPVIPVARGDIANDVVLDAVVSADAAVPVKTTAAGTVNKLYAQTGGAVAEGDTLFDVKVEIVRDPTSSVDAEGKPLPAAFRYVEVSAPIAGTLSSLDVIAGQTVAIGEVAGHVAPPTFSVTGTLQPAQRYSLVNEPTEALVAIAGGPAPFTCTGLAIVTPLPGASAEAVGGASGAGVTTGTGSGASGASSTTVTCPVPSEVTVFPGLAAQMTIAGGRAEGVLVVPTTAVRGGAQSGTVWVVGEDGAPQERAVALGLGDGRQVQVTEGLTEGENVREFAPGTEASRENAEGCVSLPGGGLECGVGG